MNYLQEDINLYKNRDKAIDAITSALKKGSLSIFIGAGIGIATTNNAFPCWSKLVENCCKIFNLDFDRNKAGYGKNRLLNNNYLLARAEEFKGRCNSDDEYIQFVKQSLYPSTLSYDKKILNTELLSSIGSLIMNSLRGSANYIVNYNYDDLIEWYLNHYGFKVQIVSIYPTLFESSDIKVLHPHGFLPFLNKYDYFATEKIVFTKTDYEKLHNNTNHPWYSMQLNILSSNLCLFIGLSGDDTSISHACRTVYQDYYEKYQRVIGFNLTINNEVGKAKENENIKRGIVNFYYDDHSQLPDLLLEICRKATE